MTVAMSTTSTVRSPSMSPLGNSPTSISTMVLNRFQSIYMRDLEMNEKGLFVFLNI